MLGARHERIMTITYLRVEKATFTYFSIFKFDMGISFFSELFFPCVPFHGWTRYFTTCEVYSNSLMEPGIGAKKNYCWKPSEIQLVALLFHLFGGLKKEAGVFTNRLELVVVLSRGLAWKIRFLFFSGSE